MAGLIAISTLQWHESAHIKGLEEVLQMGGHAKSYNHALLADLQIFD